MAKVLDDPELVGRVMRHARNSDVRQLCGTLNINVKTHKVPVELRLLHSSVGTPLALLQKALAIEANIRFRVCGGTAGG